MSDLLEKFKLNSLVYGNGLVENYKNNSLYFYEKYSKSDSEVTSIRPGQMQMGGFYFIHYLDDSKWMSYSPIFTVDFRKFGDMIVILAINFNFIPIEIRLSIFDQFIKNEDMEKDRLLPVRYDGAYKELLKYGFEYSIVEYNFKQIKFVHKINMSSVPRFLCAGHPINKYDPKKLYEIWKAKIGDQSKRHQEMESSLISDFFDASEDILESYDQLKSHIQRLQKSVEKYG
jgi:hypothetical protein